MQRRSLGARLAGCGLGRPRLSPPAAAERVWGQRRPGPIFRLYRTGGCGTFLLPCCCSHPGPVVAGPGVAAPLQTWRLRALRPGSGPPGWRPRDPPMTGCSWLKVWGGEVRVRGSLPGSACAERTATVTALGTSARDAPEFGPWAPEPWRVSAQRGAGSESCSVSRAAIPSAVSLCPPFLFSICRTKILFSF